MIKNRITYALTVSTILLLVYIYEHTMTYIALYSILLLPIISLIITILGRKKFTLSEVLSNNNIVKGETTRYFFYIKNNSFLPCANIKIIFKESSIAFKADFDDKIFSVMPYKTNEIAIEITAIYYGIYEVGVSGIILYDFLGLFSFKQVHNKRLKLSIMPNIRTLGKLPLSNFNQDEGLSKNLSLEEDYSTISDLRKYAPADGYKKIHWKVSAKKNELISKNFESTKKSPVTILLDNTRPITTYEKLIQREDKIVEACVSVLNYAHINSFTTSLYYIGVDINSQEGDFNYLYHVIANLKFVENNSFEEYFINISNRNIKTGNIIIFAQNLTSKIISATQSLSLIGNNVILFYFKEEDAKKVLKLENTRKLQFLYYNDLVL